MHGVIQRIISEPGTASPAQFARRVRMLATIYVALFLSCVTGFVLLAHQGKLFISLAQRSNVETLTIAFMLVFYGYLAVLSAPGAWGALRIWTRTGDLGPPGDGPSAAIDVEAGKLRFPLLGGRLGTLVVDGAKIEQVEARRGGSADLIAYFVRQLCEVTGADLTVVAWGHIDDEDLARYVAQVRFAQNLGRKLGAELWPRIEITEAHRQEVQRRLDELGEALVDDALLPDWEYSVEHKLPIIPEPLGLISLGRSARRADPLPTMAFALGVVLFTLGVVVLFIVRPPWVPG